MRRVGLLCTLVELGRPRRLGVREEVLVQPLHEGAAPPSVLALAGPHGANLAEMLGHAVRIALLNKGRVNQLSRDTWQVTRGTT